MVRSFKKGPFVASSILKHIERLKNNNNNSVIKTWSRSSTIIPTMVGYTFAVHNGKIHKSLFINEQMVGHKLGEFVPTRVFKSHKKTRK